ncbi:MAG: hypothetical protein KBT33_10940 [Prevotellaceae bacterium]|nr:hypothetical protein [Candidatus Minthosoma equi]
MKKFTYALTAILCSFISTMAFTACSSDDDELSVGENQVKELKAWLNINEKGECAYVCNDEGVYFVGADNQSDASKIAKNLSLGASEKGSLTLSNDLGSIRVSTPADNNGIYFEINYNVKGISVKKLCIINNEVLENGDENWYFPPKNKYYYYICKDCPAGSNEFSTTGQPTKCPKCGSTNIKKK